MGGHFRMHDAIAGGHLLHVASVQDPMIAHGVSMFELTIQDVGHRLDATVGLIGGTHHFTGGVDHGPHFSHQEKGVDLVESMGRDRSAGDESRTLTLTVGRNDSANWAKMRHDGWILPRFRPAGQPVDDRRSSLANKSEDVMANRRVFEIARDLGMSSKELRQTIDGWAIGWDVSNHMKALTPEQETELAKRLSGAAASPASAKAKTTKAKKSKSMTAKSKGTKAEKPKAQKPKAEKPKAQKPKAEKPKAEKPKAEKPKAEKPKISWSKKKKKKSWANRVVEGAKKTVEQVKDESTKAAKKAAKRARKEAERMAREAAERAKEEARRVARETAEKAAEAAQNLAKDFAKKALDAAKLKLGKKLRKMAQAAADEAKKEAQKARKRVKKFSKK